MKKILWGLLLTLAIATPVYGYSVVKGDTPFGLWGVNWKTEIAKYGISDPRKLPVGLEVELNEGMLGATPTPTSSANRKYVESPDFYLYSPAVAGDTTITLNTLKDIYGNVLTMTDLGTLGYGRIDPDSASISESITFSGITANSDGTYTLTGVKSALAKYPYTQTSGLKRSHSINAIFRLTNTAAFYDGFANKDNNEIVDGYWTFKSTTSSVFYVFPYVSSTGYTGLPSNNGDLATKYYVDTVGAGGFTSVNVSTTRGLSVDGSSPEKVGINASSTTGMTFDDSGALYQKIQSSLIQDSNGIGVSTTSLSTGGVATSTPTAGMIPIANASGTINYSFTSNIFGDGSDGNITISATTTIQSDKYYQNLTINSGVTLYTGGYRTFVRGIFINNGTIATQKGDGGNGGNATSGGAGSGGTAGEKILNGTIFGSVSGTIGGAGVSVISNNVSGNNGTNGIASSPSLTGVNGVAGGAGGTGGSNGGSGGGAGSATIESGKFSFNSYPITATLDTENSVLKTPYLLTGTNSVNTLSSSAGSGSGGSGGARSNSASYAYGGGGGGSGSSGGVLYLQAFSIINNGIISANGGNGGNGGTGYANDCPNQGIGGAGGGSGGSGGLVILIYKNISGAGSINVAGGTKGTGSAAVCSAGSPAAGANGTDGLAGKYIKIKIE